MKVFQIMRGRSRLGLLVACCIASSALLVGGAARAVNAGAPRSAALKDDIRAATKDFMRQVYIDRRVRAAYERYAAPDMVQDNPVLGTSRESTIAALEKLVATPGSQFEIKSVFVDGDVSVVSLNGVLHPGAPAAKVVEFFRWNEGKVVEHWDVMQIPS